MGPRPGDGEAVVGVPLVLTRDGKALVAGLGWGGKLEASPAPPNNWFADLQTQVLAQKQLLGSADGCWQGICFREIPWGFKGNPLRSQGSHQLDGSYKGSEIL